MRTAEEALAAAKVVLSEVQRELEHLASPVDMKVAKSIMRERLWALSALIRTGQRAAGTNGPRDGGVEGHKYAKQVLLEVSGGVPLTVCMGDRYRVRNDERKGVWTTAGYLPFSVDGCQAIIEEDTRTSGEMWKGLCGKCRNKSRRNQGRALRRRVDGMSREATVYYSAFHLAS